MLCTHKTTSLPVWIISSQVHHRISTNSQPFLVGIVSALIKNRKYWPKYIKGDAIKEHFDDKDVGDCDSWKGNMDEVPFHVYAMKEPDYVMSLMSMYGTNLRNGKETTCEWVDGSGTKKNRNFNILKWWVTTSCTATLLTITTINDTHRSV